MKADADNQKFYEKFVRQKSRKEEYRAQKRKARAEFEEFKESQKKAADSKPRGKNSGYKADGAVVSRTELFDSGRLGAEEKKLLESFDAILQELQPLNSRQLQQLPDNIRALSHQLTDSRSERRLGYMNESVRLSAYTHYFMWWNLVRLTRLFSNLEAEAFPQGGASQIVCLDLGSGPLTVVCALWIARPELRRLPLVWYCLDISQNALALGEDIYYSIASRLPPSNAEAAAHWQIIRVRDSFGAEIRRKADFITEANMFNELDQAYELPPEAKVKKYFEQLELYASPGARLLLIEPGVPKAARTLSLLRERFIKAGRLAAAPCPHGGSCPMSGFKAYTGSENKWCNLAFSVQDAPARLLRLSDSSRLPKDRAVLSFLSVIPKERSSAPDAYDGMLLLRVISDSFRLPGGQTGCYACSKFGLTLLCSRAAQDEAGTCFKSGELLGIKTKAPDSLLQRDEKSGAVKIKL